MRVGSRARGALLLVLVAISSAYFLARGPARAWGRGTIDLAVFYASSRAWLLGANPYDRGVALGVATALKPQMGVVFLALSAVFGWARTWRGRLGSCSSSAPLR